MKRILFLLCAFWSSTCGAAREVVVTAESFACAITDAVPGQTLVLDAGNGPEIDVEGHATAHHCVFANNVIHNCRNSAIRIGHHGHSDPNAAQVPFANVFVNNVLSGNTGELVRFDAPNDQLWRATSVWAEGPAHSRQV